VRITGAVLQTRSLAAPNLVKSRHDALPSPGALV
jgi:hypothetical protein